MPKRKAGRITDAELARLRRRGATLRALAEASGLSKDAVHHRLLGVLGPSYLACSPGGPLRGRRS